MPLVQSPTLKQRRFVKAYFGEAGGNKTKAAAIAYPGTDARNMAPKIWKTEGVQYLMSQEFDKRGLNSGMLSEKFTKLLKKSAPRGRVNDPRLYFDTLKEITKLSGKYPAEKKQIEQRTANLNINTTEGGGDLMAKLTELTNQMNDFKNIVKESEKYNRPEMDDGSLPRYKPTNS